jgi:2'-5' RNA ligase
VAELNMSALRVFVAVNPDRESQGEIVAFRDRLRRDLPRQGCRWAKDEQLHLTLRFVGELPSERVEELVSRLTATCGRIQPLRLAASFEGAPWANARVVALQVKCEGDQLRRLQQGVEDDVRAVGVLPDPKAFHAHLTLARIDHPNLQPKIAPLTVAEWEAREVVLVQSELGQGGATHSELARFPLQ